MNSLDTNILYYAANRNCPEHSAARSVLDRLQREPRAWIVADQVLFEFYRLVRNPRVVERPLGAAEASEFVRLFREELGCLHCAYDQRLFPRVLSLLRGGSFAASRTFDAVLAVTLADNGVQTFYTRNVRDFADFDWFRIVDPIG